MTRGPVRATAAMVLAGLTLATATPALASSQALTSGVKSYTSTQTDSTDYQLAGTVEFNVAPSDVVTLSGTISDQGPGTKGTLETVGIGTLILSGTDTYSGGTIANGGTLKLSGTGSLGASTGSLSINYGATVDLGGKTQTQSGVTLNNGTITNGTLDTGGTFDLYSGAVSAVLGDASATSAGALVKNGSGTVTLFKANTYSGGTTINGGTLMVTAAGTLGSVDGNLTINNGATLDLGGSTQSQASVTLNNGTIQTGTLDSSGAFILYSGTVLATLGGTSAYLVKQGSGTVTLAGPNTFRGNTVISQGTIIAGNDKAFSNTAVVMSGGTGIGFDGSGFTLANHFDLYGTDTFTVGTGNSETLSGVISDYSSTAFGELAKSGAGTLILSGANTYSGGTSINDGTLQLQGSGTLGSANGSVAVKNGATLDLGTTKQSQVQVTLDSGVISNGELDASRGFVLNSGTVSAVLGGAGYLQKDGSGTVTLSGGNTYKGGTTINGGTLQLQGAGTLGDATGSLTINKGATLDLGKTTQTQANVTLTNGTIKNGELDTPGTFTLSSGTVSATLGGSGGLTINKGAGTVTLSGNNTYGGKTLLLGGTIIVGSNTAFSTSTVTVFPGGVNGLTTISFGSSGLDLANNFDLAGGEVGLNVKAGYTDTLSGVISGYQGLLNVGLTKNGPGTLILTGNNSIPNVVLNNGTLKVTGAGSLGGRNVTINNGSILDLGTTKQTVVVLTLNSGTIKNGEFIDLLGRYGVTGPFDLYSGTISARISGAAFLSKNGSGTVTLSGDNNYSGMTYLLGGTLIVGSSTAFGTSRVHMNGKATVGFDRSGLDVGNEFDIFRNGIFDVGAGSSATLSGPIKAAYSTDPSLLEKTGGGTLVLSGANTYTDGTLLNAGTLSATNNSSFGTGTVTMAAGTTVGFSQTGITLANAFVLNGDPTYNVATGNTDTISGAISDGTAPGVVEKTGGGTLVLANTSNSYTGGTTVQAGTLQFAGGGSLGTGTITLDGGTTFTPGLSANSANITLSNDFVLNSGTVTIDLQGADAVFSTLEGLLSTNGNSLTLNGNILGGGKSGGGKLVLSNPGYLTLNGNNSYAGGTVLGGFTQVNVGSDTALGTGTVYMSATSALRNDSGSALTLANDIVIQGDVLGGNNDLTLTGVVSSPVRSVLDKVGSGTLDLANAANTFGGIVRVDAGTLKVNGALTNSGVQVDVKSGATLGGSGTIAGAVTIEDGGTIAPGNSPGTVTVGSLILNPNSNLDFQFGQANVSGGPNNDKIVVNGNLTLDGTLNVLSMNSIGVYNPITYGGTLTDNGLAVNFGGTPYSGTIETSIPGEVNLIVTSPGTLTQYWDGADMLGNGTIDGGTGTWSTIGTNWTTAAPSTLNASWQGGVAVFGGTAGTVSLASDQTFQGLDFTTDGYVLNSTGGNLNFNGQAFIATATGVTTTINTGIGGTGDLYKQGGGTLVLNGQETYTGDTYLQGGTLGLGISGTSYALGGGTLYTSDGTAIAMDNTGQSTLTNNVAVTGNLTFTGTGDLALGGIVSGGSLTLDGGTLRLANSSNSYAGGTFLNAGILVAEGSSVLGSGTVTMQNNAGLLVFADGLNIGNDFTLNGNSNIFISQGATTTLSGLIGGSGILDKQAAGTLILTNPNNNYGGGTIVSAGTLQVDASGVLGSNTVSLNDGTTLAAGASGLVIGNAIATSGTDTIDQGSGTFTLSGDIGGSGALNVVGSGNLILGGSNSFAGGMTIAGGTVTSSVAGLGGGTIQDNGALVIQQDSNGSFVQAIDGTGSLTKSGSGMLMLSGTSQLSGPTNVTGGMLYLSGSLANSAMTVDTGAALVGTGTTGSLTVASGGSVAPGNPIGTLNVNGDLNLAAGSTYLANVSSAAGSQIAASGTASIAGNLVVTPHSGQYAFYTSYTLISSSGLSGTFANASLGSYGAAIKPVLVYGANSVSLVLRPVSLVQAGGGNLSGNALAVAQAFDSAVQNRNYNPTPFLPVYQQGSATLAGYLNQLSGQLHSAQRRVLLDSTRVVRETALDQLDAGRFASPATARASARRGAGKVTVFGRVAGSWTTTDGDAIGGRVTTSQSGFLTGITYAANGYKVGVMFDHLHTDLDGLTMGTSRLTSNGGTVFFGYHSPGSGPVLNLGASLAGTRADGSRAIAIPGLVQSLNGRTNGTSYQAFGEAAYDLVVGKHGAIEPFARLAYTRLHSDAFSETGGIAAVHGTAQSADLTITTLGARAAISSGIVRVSASAGWQHTAGNRSAPTMIALDGVDTPALIRSAALPENATALGANIGIRLSRRIRFNVDYTGIMSSRYANNGLRATLSARF